MNRYRNALAKTYFLCFAFLLPAQALPAWLKPRVAHGWIDYSARGIIDTALPKKVMSGCSRVQVTTCLDKVEKLIDKKTYGVSFADNALTLYGAREIIHQAIQWKATAPDLSLINLSMNNLCDGVGPIEEFRKALAAALEKKIFVDIHGNVIARFSWVKDFFEDYQHLKLERLIWEREKTVFHPDLVINCSQGHYSGRDEFLAHKTSLPVPMEESIKNILQLPDEKQEMAKELNFSYSSQLYAPAAAKLLEAVDQWKKQGLFKNLVRINFSECSYLKHFDDEYGDFGRRIDESFIEALAKVLELGICVDITDSAKYGHHNHVAKEEWVNEFFEWVEQYFQGRIDKNLLVWKHPDQLEREIFGWLR